MPLSFLSVFSLQLAFHDLYSVFHFVNPLTPEAFCPKCIFWTFWIFSGWVLAKLAKLSSQKGICNITACLSSTSILFYNMLAQACEEIKILETWKWAISFQVRLLYLFNFFFSFPFSLFFSFCCSDWPSNGFACSWKSSKKASSRQANFTME